MSNESLIGSALNKNIKNKNDLNCPLCGGMAKRRLDKFCVKIFYGFLIFTVLALIIFILNCFGNMFWILFLPYLGIIIAGLLFILPITAAIAIASRSRCQSCGHHFWPASIAPNIPADVRSPGILTVMGIAIILAVFYIQTVFIKNSPGNEMLGVFIEIAGWIFLASIILGLCMIGQAFFWRNLITEIHSGEKNSILFFSPFLFIISAAIAFPFCFRYAIANNYIYLNRAQDVLFRAKLATLPESASSIHVYTPQTIFSSSDYLNFEADTNDIEEFITDSSALEGPTYENHLTWFDDKPSWFNPKQINKIYKFDKQEDTYHGEVIVDNDKHIVYVSRWK